MALRRHCQYTIEHQRTKDQFYIEALEAAFNDHKLAKIQEIERLEMRLEDVASKDLRN